MTPAEMGLSAAVALMGGGNLWNWLASRGKTKVDLITLGQTIAAATITAQREERSELMARIDELEEKVDLMAAHIEKLEQTIIELGATPPARPAPKRVAK